MVEEFAAAAEGRFRQLGYGNVGVRAGDGSRGWAERAPFDKIIVTAAAREVPPALLGQLRPGGRMVLPRGGAEAQRGSVTMPADASRPPTAPSPVLCSFCGEEAVLELAEAWSDHAFTLGTCCSAPHEALSQGMADEPGWARDLLRRLGAEDALELDLGLKL